jgi:riboflavin synthase
VTEIRDDGFAADLQPVTLRLSNFAKLRVGDNVNLERSLAVGDRFGGHYVQGHIDGIARVVALVGEGPAVLVRLWLPVDLRRYVVERGFITVDGASLTVMRLWPDGAEVSLVDHTQESITLTRKRPNDWVNVEVDVMVKHVERLQGLAQKTDISMDLLRQNGFV